MIKKQGFGYEKLLKENAKNFFLCVTRQVHRRLIHARVSNTILIILISKVVLKIIKSIKVVLIAEVKDIVVVIVPQKILITMVINSIIIHVLQIHF
jgi:hypothetical protein